ncbi:MAG: DHA2 family efflux MFS transporter permease subunit [Gaiellaceae bacterium]
MKLASGGTDRRWLVLALAVTAQFMVILDVAIVNVALPAIKRDLGFSQESLQWVITAYSILFGGTLLLGGRLADLLGRRRLFVAGVALFAVGSLLSGLAWSEGSLIGSRALQGFGGALLSPAALSIVITAFPEGRERNVALGIWGAASGSGGAAGVLLGGLLTSYAGWSWIFFINLPVAAAVIAAVPWLVHESRAALAHRHFDLLGAGTITAGLMLLVYAMTRATQHGWSENGTIALLAASAALVGGFLAVERFSRAPLLPLRIFRLRTLSAANATMLTIGAIAFSQFFLLSLYMQDVLGYSPIQSGLAFIAATLSIVVFSTAAQAWTTRFGVRRVLTAGLLASAAALALYARMPAHGHYFWDVFPAYALGGFGLALAFVPVTIAGLTGVQPEDAGVASGLINTGRQIGGAIGLAAAATIATTTTSRYLTTHASSADLAQKGLTHGFQAAFAVLGVLALLGALVAATFVRSTSPRAVEETRQQVAELEKAA